MSDDPQSAEFDYIVVGAGSAGCVLAERLSADPRHRVLLIEEGPRDDSNIVTMPKGFGKLLSQPERTHYYQTSHDRGVGGAPEVWARGRMLGGSSAINGMVWIRGQPRDYDDIAAMGNPGWSWSDLLPYFRRIEDHGLGESPLRGVGGPIAVNTHPHPSRLGEAFIAAGQAIGLPPKSDQNQEDQEGIGHLQWNIDRRGRRVSAARGFLEPSRGRKNLAVVTGVRIDRVLFDADAHASGVEGVRDGKIIRFRSRNEILLSAGALGSPRILQLSGIGNGSALQHAGVAVRRESPRIGFNMREHHLLALNYRLKSASDSQNRAYTGLTGFMNFARYLVTGTGPLTWGSSEAAAFMRVLPGSERPDVQIMFAPYSLDYSKGSLAFESEPGMQVYSYLLRPDSQGSVLLSGPDPAAPLAIDPNYHASPLDRSTNIAGVRATRRIMRQDPLQPFVIGETAHTSGYQTDEEILAAFRLHGQSGLHAVGTASMGPNDADPLDPQLRVRGVSGLRVMDCSVLPVMISGNTNAPMMALAWRAADLILSQR